MFNINLIIYKVQNKLLIAITILIVISEYSNIGMFYYIVYNSTATKRIKKDDEKLVRLIGYSL